MADASSNRLDGAAALAFVGAFLAVALVYVAVFLVPPLITVFVDDLGLSHSQAGSLMSLYLVGYAVASLVSGQLADRFGAITVMATGVALAGASSLLFAATDELGVFLVARVGVGIATGLVYAPGIMFVTRLLPARQLNTGIGIYFAGLSAGVSVAFVSTPLLEDATSWRLPFVVFGLAIAAGALLFVLMARPVSARASRPPERRSTTAPFRTRELFSNRSFVQICVALFVSMFVAFGTFTWIAPFLDESAGFSAGQISLALGISVALGMPATVIAGWASDRLQRPLTVAGIGFAMVFALIVLAAVDEISFGLATVMSIVATFGATGALVPLFALPAMVVTPDAAAKAMGMATSAAMTGAIVSTFLGGWLVGATDGYVLPFALFSGVAAVALVLIFPLAALAVRNARSTALT